MCVKHSFVQDRTCKVYNGGGFEESHTAICLMNEVDQDKVNAYEWQPPENWPNCEGTDGIKKDQINFDEKNTHIDAIDRYLKKLFPTKESFNTYFLDDSWHGKEVETQQGKMVFAIKPQLIEVRNAIVQAMPGSNVCAWENSTVTARENSTVTARGNSTVTAYGNSTVPAWENSTVTAWENSTVTAWENSTVTARENSTVTAYGNSTVTAWENSTVTAWENSTVTARGNSNIIKPNGYSWDDATIKDLLDNAVIIDRSGDKVVVTKARKKSE